MSEYSENVHADVPGVIMKLKDLNGHQKILLALIGIFSNTGKGYKKDNESTGEMLGITSRTASRCLCDLEAKDYTISTKSRSSYRRIFIADNDKTKEILLRQKWSTSNIQLRQKVCLCRTDSTRSQPVLSTINRSKCKVSKNNAKASGGSTKNSKTTKATFRNPTGAEVSAYAKEIDYDLDGDAFVDFYESKGWVGGKSPMKNWKACVRTWKTRDKKPEPKAYPDYSEALNQHTRDVTEKEAEALMAEVEV